MNESGFTQYIMRKLRPDVYCWKIMNTMQNGIPDCYFSGTGGDLWAEMKWINKVPKRNTTIIEPNLSELQRRWLNARRAEGRTVCVIIGTPEGCYLFTDGTWDTGITRDQLTLSRADIIEWIREQTLG